MKTKKVIFLVFFGLFILFALGFHSCSAIGCYDCKRTNSQTGKTEKYSTCDSNEADKLRNEGWTCKGGW
jgi:hypothetical protein